jgi:hypothetical protein
MGQDATVPHTNAERGRPADAGTVPCQTVALDMLDGAGVTA